MAKLIGDIGAVAAFLVFAGYVLFYGLFSPWWRSATGRSVMALVGVLAAIMALTVSTLLFGVQWPARMILRAIIFWSVATAGGWLLVTNVRQKLAAWRHAQRSREGEDDEARIRVQAGRVDGHHLGHDRRGTAGQ